MATRMTRQHFQAIADSVAEEVELIRTMRTECNNDASDIALDHMSNVVMNLSRELRRFNPAFDRERFEKACGLGDKK